MSLRKTKNLKSRDNEGLLADYLAVTRTNGPDRHDSVFAEIYASYYESLARALKPSLIAPPLHVVYTLQRQVELVSMKGSKYLVYDRYLGQTMNMLNRIVLNSKDPMDGEMYLFKLLAEESSARGRLATAMFFGLVHLELKSKNEGYREDVDYARRAGITHLQECFVLAHELAHLTVDEYSADANSGQFESFSAKHADALLRKIATQIGCDEIDYKFSTDRLLPGLIEEIPHRSDVVLECLVDAVASLLLIRMLGIEWKKRGADFIIATALCLRHLRVLGIVRDILDEAWNDEAQGVIKRTRDYIVRTSSIRGFLRYVSEKFDIASPELIDVAEKYEALIDDPLMFSVTGKLKELEARFAATDSVSLEEAIVKDMRQSSAGEPSLEEVLSMTGFLGQDAFSQKLKRMQEMKGSPPNPADQANS